MALDGIDLNVRQGEIFGLLGANGAGKSTLFEILSGSIKQTKGAYKIHSYNNLLHLRQDIGICKQMDILYDYLTCNLYFNFKNKSILLKVKNTWNFMVT